MKARRPFALLLVAVSLALVLSWAVMAQGQGTETLPDSTSPTILPPAPTATATWQTSQENPKSRRQTILLWPKGLEQFIHEYPSWESWVENGRASPYSLRDELLVSVRAIATMIPDLVVSPDEYGSGIIIVSGNPAALGALLDRLREHPLLAQVTEDSRARRDEARAAWAKQRFDPDFGTLQRSPARTVNIRNNWVANVVWGYGTPNTTVYVTLTRTSLHSLTTTATVSLEGLYHAYLAWEIRDGDVIEVNDGTEIKRVSVIPLRASGESSVASVTGVALPAPDAAGKPSITTPHSLEVTIGRASQTVTFDSEGAFATDFSDQPFRPGTPGFLRYTDVDKSRIYKPFSISIINVRRDTSNGTPYGDTHSAGISSIVWGSSTPSSTLMITLTRSGSFVVTRTVAADQVGSFSVSVDRLIEDGDIVQASDGASVRTVQVPTMSFHTDPATRMITGSAPAGITTTVSGAPHSLEASIAGDSRQVTTTVTGKFSADFTSRPFLASLLGTLRYTTPSGDRVYKPLFVADPLARGKLGDWRADVILGQPDFSQITPNEVVGNKIFNPFGLYVDRSVQPNRIYVYDSGNSRVLGLSHLGVCLAGPKAGQHCTTNSDCPTSSCQIQEYRVADIVFGQPSFNSSACNGDSGYQMYPDVPMASAGTLCGLREEQVSITEGGSAATMAADTHGNLYVPDFFNNRVLRYNGPFTTDSVADYVWGQADFSGITCNRGASFFGHPDSRSLCLAPPPDRGDLRAGVAIDSAGNLWVADTNNNRVLRFPYSSTLSIPVQEANLVLGQPDFSTNVWGTNLNQMNKPASVRVDISGVVYVADSSNNRVLMFVPPFSNGMQAKRVLGSGLRAPIGLEIDPNGGIWVNDNGNSRIVHFVNEVQGEVITSTDVLGGLGIDQDGNLMSTLSGYFEEVAHFSAPTYTLDAEFLRSEPEGALNQTGSHGLYGGIGLEVAAGQLVYADVSRILFWNDPWRLTDYQPADGVVGAPDFQTRTRGGSWFGRMRSDRQNRLWVIQGAADPARVLGYQLPLVTGALPVFTLTSPLPVQGGGVFTWTEFLGISGIDVQSNCDCLWLSDTGNNRAFRIRNVSTQPVVDIVLGQRDLSGTHCNQGRDSDDGYTHPISPTQDSLCHPGALAFDRNGNLYLADHNLEVAGNWRLLEFDANILPKAPISAVFGISATHVFGRNGSFIEPNCPSRVQDPMCGPWEPTFDSRGRMVIGFNGYWTRFPVIYQDPLTNPLPVAALGDFHSMPLSARFDQFDNLYILDHNRSRVLIYRDRQVETYSVTGTIKTPSGVPVPGVQVETVGYASSGTTDASGIYALTGLITGTYVLTPSKDYYGFTPFTRTVSVPPSIGEQDFVAIAPLTGVIISGPISGIVQKSYTFTATAGPTMATLPITYVWRATGQLPVTHTGSLSDTATFTWNIAGTNVITLTAINAGGTVTDNYTVNVGAPPSGVTITGPTTGTLNTALIFTAAVSPVTASQPINYIWQTTGQSPVTHTEGLSDTISLAWDTFGTQVITVTASNVGGTVSATHVITIGPRYVALSGVDKGNDCVNSNVPCATVQHAVDVANLGDEIRVAAGTYHDISVHAGITSVVYISKTVTIYGGYTTTNWAIPYPITQPTTLDAQNNGCVLYIQGPGITPTVSGFTITGGIRNEGAGVYVNQAAARIVDNVIVANQAPGYFGGGIYLWQSNGAIVQGNLIHDNTARYGGGIGSQQSAAQIRANRVYRNTAWGGGGLMVYDNGPIQIDANYIYSNTGQFSAGGVWIESTSRFTLTNNIIADNQNNSDSGFKAVRASGLMLNNTLANNQSGAAVMAVDSSVLVLTNTLLYNHAVSYGTVGSGTQIRADHTLWDGSGTYTQTAPGEVIVTTNDLTGNPNFIRGAEPATYHITSTSPAINTGVDVGLTVDIDGDPRPQGNGYDIGADEYSGDYLVYLPVVLRDY